ncbi:DUF3078 domain-containing protein [Ochrovirga pacifica]|uniref:DUF3078 domain-containing protein n=1 Tax=Ochrovirga pacifica TaxID=1042376 RepID=UPI00135F1374|nr:DUF3078 domain-containing protein [Ochrovirga pacifica]
MIGFICLGIQTSYAATELDTVPVPKSVAKIKSSIKKIFTKKQKDSIASSKDSIQKILKESVKRNYWTHQNKPGILFTQTSFVNWTKGGNNTIAGIASFKGDYDYKRGQFFWKNDFLIKYGLSKEDDIDHALKTDDIIDIKSAVGYKKGIESRWYYSGDFSLTTQIAKGYNDKKKTTVISNFFAPARMRIGLGAAYSDKDDNFKLNISPLTNQVTFVIDQELANKGAFGVEPAKKDGEGNIIEPGKNVNSEFGTLISIEYKTLIMKNINFAVKSSFYSDYLNRFGNVDSDIELNINMKVNKYIQSTISSHLLYDDDTKTPNDDGTQGGPKVQLKQILGVGVSYVF